MRSLRVHGGRGAPVWAHAVLGAEQAAGQFRGDVRLFDDSGRVVVELEGLLLRRTSRDALERAAGAGPGDWFHELVWRPAALPAPASPAEPGTWVLLADRGGAGERLAALLEARGETCVRVPPPGADVKADHAGRPADVQVVLEAGLADRPPLRGVVHLTALDTPCEPTVESLSDLCESAVAAARTMALQPQAGGARLWLVTRGAQPVAGAGAPGAVPQAALWGLGRTVALEHPELRCVCVDLDPASGDVDGLFRELWSDDRENQVALRGAKRHVARLQRASLVGGRRPPADPGALQLQIPTRGVLDNLSLVPVARRPPGRGEVALRVRASGLNFRDVLNVLGMYPGDAGPLGTECSGTVVAVGEDVAGVAVGDEVVALAPGAFATHATTRADFVAGRPASLSPEDAAAAPIAFLTAQYGLHRLARLKAGERVLVHAAAGGVGLAAVQVALRAGAVVYATAGSEEKRSFVRALGVRQVMDSRSLAFADEVRASTGGAGVDVVLNSLSGDFIEKSLSVLAKAGRFLEIGKRGIWDRDRVAGFRGDVAYFAYDLAEEFVREPALARSMLRELMDAFARSELDPLPHRVFPLRDAVHAFRYMAQARHIGKVVLSPGLLQTEALPTEALPTEAAPTEAAPTEAAPTGTVSIRADGTYLVTGGLGSLGLVVAAWLVEKGARSLSLVGRRPPSEAARASIRELESAGARVIVASADVSRPEDVARVLDQVGAEAPPLRGIVHAAGLLDDAPVLKLDRGRLARVLAPKAMGAWNLHAATAGSSLDFVLLFSSVASVLGSAGQGNYAAANAFLDGLAAHDRSLGRHVLSVSWGPWAEVGMAAQLSQRDQQRRAEQGVAAISPGDGKQVLDRLLGYGGAHVAVVPVDWRAFLLRFAPGPPPVVLSELAVAAPGAKPVEAGRPALVGELEAAPAAERRELLEYHVRDRALQVLGLPPEHPLNTHQPLNEMGLDSLMAVELRNALGVAVGMTLPATLLFDYPTVEALTRFLAGKLGVLEAPDGSAATEAQRRRRKEEEERARAVAEVKRLSDAEVEALISKELGSLPE